MRRVPILLALLLPLLALAQTPKPVAEPDLPDGTKAATQQMAGFRYPKGLKVELWAAEPKLMNPVAFCIDDQGRIFVAEEFRFNRGTEENRTRGFFLEDDLQVNTLEDRLKMYKKHEKQFTGGMDYFTKHGDRVKLLEDTKGTGKADRATVFADGFNEPLDGLAAGVLAYNGDVYLTNIPNLWKLKDTKGTGTADKKEKLLTGFGVNCAFLGHDLHGLTIGPDGKLYFSIGDRGFHVKTLEGTKLSGPRTGAVFRCDLDGKNLEVVHRGLRNPQELAFDQFGNLFADDNNCDKGDHARLVYVVEGGESGWNMAYQTIPEPYMAGPWFAERLWHLQHEGQPAYIVPPVGKIGTGPAGFCFNSGTTLPDRYKNAFFMANYTGNGGIESWRVKQAGAGFEIEDYHDMLKPFYATDVDFGPDGKMYVSDFGALKWDGTSNGGRIFTLFDPEKIASNEVQQMKKLFAEGFDKQKPDALMKLLEHADQKVRLRAQFQLVKTSPEKLEGVVKESKNQLARLHAIWGLGMAARQKADFAQQIQPFLKDADAEVRAQAAKVLGELKLTSAADTLVSLLKDDNARVKFFAAQALGQIKPKNAVPALFEMLKANKDSDKYVRHAAVTALTRIGDADAVNAYAKDASYAVRLAVVLVQRKLADKRVSQFLNDADFFIRAEAARAIHDTTLETENDKLAAILLDLGKQRIPDGDPLVRRAISAAYRLGTKDHAKAVLGVVTNANFSEAARAEALSAIRDWDNPPPRDRVTGFWKPLPKRDPVAKDVVEAGLNDLLAKTNGKLQTSAVELLGKLSVKVDEAKFAEIAADTKQEAALRAASLRLLHLQKYEKLKALVEKTGVDTKSPEVRIVSRNILAELDPKLGLRYLVGALAHADATVAEKQAALVTMSQSKDAETSSTFEQWMKALAGGTVDRSLHLDLWEVTEKDKAGDRATTRKKFEETLAKVPFGKHSMTLHGGDAERGRDIFFNHTAAQCVRCHKVNDIGGVAGPDLTKLVQRNPEKTREYILESIISPNAKIAKGFANITVTLLDGRIIAGTVVDEDKKTLTLQTPDSKKVTVEIADIEKRTQPTSNMPSGEGVLKPRELRDLIEFLATLK